MKIILFSIPLFLLTSCISREISEIIKTEQSEESSIPQKFKVMDAKLDFLKEENQVNVQMKIRNVGAIPLKDPVSIDVYCKLFDTDTEDQVVTVKCNLEGLEPNMVSKGEAILTFPDKYFDKDRQFQICIVTPHDISYWQVDYSVNGSINVPDWEEGDEITFTPYDPADLSDPNNPNSPYYKGNK